MFQQAIVDPDVARFVQALLAGTARHPDFSDRSLPDQRRILADIRRPWREGGPAIPHGDIAVGDAGESVTIRIFLPEESLRPAPVLIYMHGGGFVYFGLDTHDRLMRELAARSGMAVVGVDYALAPEALFPKALNQVVSVVDWVAREGRKHGLDPDRIFAGGDSAGANLALSAGIVLRDRGDNARLSGLLLNYGFFDADSSTPSHRRYGGPGEILTTRELDFYMRAYVGENTPLTHPLVQPALADLHGLPPSFHVIAQCDPLADCATGVAARLSAESGQVDARVYSGATHSFLEAIAISALAAQALDDAAAWLKERAA